MENDIRSLYMPESNAELPYVSVCTVKNAANVIHIRLHTQHHVVFCFHIMIYEYLYVSNENNDAESLLFTLFSLVTQATHKKSPHCEISLESLKICLVLQYIVLYIPESPSAIYFHTYPSVETLQDVSYCTGKTIKKILWSLKD